MNDVGRYSIGSAIREEVIEVPALVPGAVTLPLLAERSSILWQLLIFNLVLQIFDGIATYNGLSFSVREGNPLLRAAFHVWGVVPGLLVFKGYACLLLVLVYRIASADLAMTALGLLAAVYSVCSLIPWLAILFKLLVRFA